MNPALSSAKHAPPARKVSVFARREPPEPSAIDESAVLSDRNLVDITIANCESHIWKGEGETNQKWTPYYKPEEGRDRLYIDDCVTNGSHIHKKARIAAMKVVALTIDECRKLPEKLAKEQKLAKSLRQYLTDGADETRQGALAETEENIQILKSEIARKRGPERSNWWTDAFTFHGLKAYVELTGKTPTAWPGGEFHKFINGMRGDICGSTQKFGTCTDDNESRARGLVSAIGERVIKRALKRLKTETPAHKIPYEKKSLPNLAIWFSDRRNRKTMFAAEAAIAWAKSKIESNPKSDSEEGRSFVYSLARHMSGLHTIPSSEDRGLRLISRTPCSDF